MSYPSVVLADSPLHFWRLSDGSGQICHDIGSSKHLLASSFYALGYTGPCSDGGAALTDSQFGLVSGESLALVAPVSVECWVWWEGTFAGTQVIFAWDNTTAPSLVLTNTAGVVQASVSGCGATVAFSMTSEAWHHLVVTYSGAFLAIYEDGVQKSLVACGTAMATSHLIGFGVQPVGGGFKANSLFSELAVYPTALTSAQVSAHFAAADQVASVPVHLSTGKIDLTTGGFTSIIGDTTDILKSVRKVY